MSNEIAKQLTWEQIKEIKSGTILYDEFDEGIRFIIIRGPSALTAYIGIPLNHPLASFDYDELPISAHGGLTYDGEGTGDPRPINFYWYGWDYGHSGDYCFYDDDWEHNYSGKKWLVKDVISDSWETKYDFKSLMKLAEKLVK